MQSNIEYMKLKGLILIWILMLIGCGIQPDDYVPLKVYTVPVKFHVMQSQWPPLNGDITEHELHIVISKVNEIWAQAGIQFSLHRYRKLAASNEKPYMDMLRHQVSRSKEQRIELLKSTCQVPNLQVSYIEVCIIGELFNYGGGVYYNDDKPLAMWPTKLNKRKWHNAASLAHELGHALGLPHNYLSPQYLMQGMGATILNSKKQFFKLTGDEINSAREQIRFYKSQQEYSQ
jgi:hypothetical protein